MEPPLIVDESDPKWKLLESTIKLFDARKIKKITSKHGFKPLDKAVTVLKISIAAMFFSCEISYVVKELINRTDAAHLRKKFSTKIAMHSNDSGMIEHRDMFWNRKKSFILIRMRVPILFGFGKSERLKPDLFIDNGYDLSEYGFDAKVLHIPGHSEGSIGILTEDGNLFCGDLLINTDRPVLNSIMGDLKDANTSVEKLKSSDLEINTVYPGHGKPFPWDLSPDKTISVQNSI